MAYNLYITESDITYKILNKYKKKVFTLKQNAPCKNGNFIIGSIIAIINAERIDRPDNKLFVNLEIFDIKENIQDVLTIFAESNDDLDNILKNLFVIDKTKTEYYEQYDFLCKQADDVVSTDKEWENVAIKMSIIDWLMAILGMGFLLCGNNNTIIGIIGIILIFMVIVNLLVFLDTVEAIIESKYNTLIKKSNIIYNKILATND